ncbi:MAG: hypothetical protein OXE86_05365 [Alphaproteobacteria bacterium]|nr:hypothetical protein [Alphaproteobacteria bacterium]
MGSKDAKSGKTDEPIFRLFSNGYKTGRDAYVYNFSKEACAENARNMVDNYVGALEDLEKTLQEWKENPESQVELISIVDDITQRHSSSLRWDSELKSRLRRQQPVGYSEGKLKRMQYRPFAKQYCYVEHLFAQRKYQLDSIFPECDSENRAICVPAVGSRRPFAALVVDTMPDLHFVEESCQCFPRYRYQIRTGQQSLPGLGPPPERLDNISETALRAFRAQHGDNGITKDAIFDYVYGVLHAPAYRERFANDLAKDLPRIPFAADFQAFAEAGRRLSELYLGYETCPQYPLGVEFIGPGEPRPEHHCIGERAMRFADDERTALTVNDHVRLVEIPPEAHEYEVNGRTPLEWFIDRYRIARDRQSGIVNDPNAWFDDPRDLIAAFRRIVHVSVETSRIVASLPCPFPDSEGASGGEHR